MSFEVLKIILATQSWKPGLGANKFAGDGSDMKRLAAKRKSVKLAVCFLALLTTVECTGCGGSGTSKTAPPPPPPPQAGNYLAEAAAGITTLQSGYNQSNGQYPSGWWHAANSITMLANYEMLAGDTQYESVIANTFVMAPKSNANFIDSYFDDNGWWALTWINAYDLTKNQDYLTMAESIFTQISTKGWDTTTCGGGVWWNTDRQYKNAITNELFLTIAAKLANRTTGTAQATYLNWAEQEWTWFKGSGMINSQNRINDGLTSTNPAACVNNGETTWTYNLTLPAQNVSHSELL